MNLRLDWATYEASKYACENWHYSKCMPTGSLLKVGAWENNKFIGVVLFGHGATYEIGAPYGMNQFECIELVRIAFNKHQTPISKVLAIALKFLKKQSPGIKLVVSYADPAQGHHGGIYQATNWIYQGQIDSGTYSKINGKVFHRRSIFSKYGTSSIQKLKSKGLKVEKVSVPGKHKYIMPLDNETKNKFLHLSKPYPKRPKPSSEASEHHSEKRQCDSDLDAPISNSSSDGLKQGENSSGTIYPCFGLE